MEYITHQITLKDSDMRLDRFLRNTYPHLIQGRIEKSLRKGLIKLNGKKAESKDRTKEGDEITLPISLTVNDRTEEEKQTNSKPKITEKKRKFLIDSILYKDDDIIIINKPIGLSVQGGSGIHTSVDDMLDYLQFDEEERPKLTHRLDKDTSGVLILARNRKAAQRIAEYFKTDQIQKFYWAVCAGEPKHKMGVINHPIIVDGEKKEAITEYRLIDYLHKRASFIEFKLITGRKHQIRIHASQVLNTPIVGDGKYGGEAAFIDGINIKLHLHARRVIFKDKGKLIDVTAPLHPHLIETFRVCGFEGK
ncbi:MAG: RluA family pseudouridine synthase [Sphingobacteriia bacterium]|nr:RluA family pseudouridine synthase [Sphingobacteriia bacterium]